MIKKIYRLFNYLKLKFQNNDVIEYNESDQIIPDSIEEVRESLEKVFYDCDDFSLREITLGENSRIKILVAYIDGLIDKSLINEDILRPLMMKMRQVRLELDDSEDDNKDDNKVVEYIKNNILCVGELSEIKGFNQLINTVLSGDTLIYINGQNIALKAGTRGWESRGVQEPETEAVVRGPREGFTETLRSNTALLRRKIRNPKLKFETMKIGKQTNTDVSICYIKGLVHRDILETVRRRLKKIKIDAILESGYIEEFIEDAPFSIFPTVGNSEKPDVVAGKILEGRVAVLCDGTPFVLTVPHLFVESLISSEDYYSRPFFASLVRLLRIMALILTVTLPAIYIAMVSFHHDVIPFKLLLTITASREGIPFSVFTETLLMGIAYELLREAGVRMPRPIGQAVSIVGALVLGQAAVEAGIASNPVVMITALTAITSFVLPPLGGTIPIIRIILIISANILGLLGMGYVIVAFFVHMCTLRSFGVPYLAPFSPLTGMDLKDTFIRMPLWSMWTRPMALIKNNKNIKNTKYRMKKDIKSKED